MVADTGAFADPKFWRSLLTRGAAQRIVFTVGAFLIYRFGALWPAPGLDTFMIARHERDGRRIASDGGTFVRTLLVASVFSLIVVTLEILTDSIGVFLIEGEWLIALVLVCLSILPNGLASYFPFHPKPEDSVRDET